VIISGSVHAGKYQTAVEAFHRHAETSLGPRVRRLALARGAQHVGDVGAAALDEVAREEIRHEQILGGHLQMGSEALEVQGVEGLEGAAFDGTQVVVSHQRFPDPPQVSHG
jgi:hypothetical protein